MPQASSVATWLLAYRYPIVFPLAIAEGPIVMLLAGFFVRTGLFDFWPIYLLLMAGDLTGDIVWYWVGRRGARPLINRFGKILGLTEESVEKLEKQFIKHDTKILFISKITMGLGFALATLIAAGAAKVDFKKYFFVNFFGGFIWTGILMAIGYFFGNLYGVVDKSFHWLLIIGVIIIGSAIVWGFGKIMRRKFQ